MEEKICVGGGKKTLGRGDYLKKTHFNYEGR